MVVVGGEVERKFTGGFLEGDDSVRVSCEMLQWLLWEKRVSPWLWERL